jgi:hypothetical protein
MFILDVLLQAADDSKLADAARLARRASSVRD